MELLAILTDTALDAADSLASRLFQARLEGIRAHEVQGSQHSSSG